MRRNHQIEPAPTLTLGALLAGLACVLGFSRGVLAIPTNPDPCHTEACTPWSSVAINTLNPATDQHQHRNTQNLFGVAGQYKTYAAWDNNQYRYNGAADRALNKAQDGRDFGHGYMDQAALYRFNLNAGFAVPVWAQALLNTKIVTVWEGMVNGAGTNVHGVATQTRIDFDQVMAGENILIQFAPQYPSGAAGNIMMNDFPYDSDIDDFGNPSMPPPGGGGAPQGGRSGVLAFWTPSIRTLTFNSLINWYKDDTGNAADDLNPNIQGNTFDFVTTALHEWGHVIGLDHPAGEVAGTIMYSGQARRGFATGIVRGFDPGTVDGARNLYTIAPEPGSLGLLLIGGLLALRRRHIAQPESPARMA